MINRVRQYIAPAICVAALFIATNGCSTEKTPTAPIQTYGNLTVGEQMPKFHTLADRELTNPSAVQADRRFAVFNFTDSVYGTCVDSACGPMADVVLARSGQLVASSDGKVAKLIGLEIVSTRPWKLAHSLFVATDCTGRVLSIYVDLDETHFARAIDSLEPNNRCPGPIS